VIGAAGGGRSTLMNILGGLDSATGYTRAVHAHGKRSPRGVGGVVRRADDRGARRVALIAAGLSNDEVAAQLYVTSSTAKTHANRAMAKLRARDRAQLVVFAYQAGNPCSRIPAWGAVARPDQRSPRPGGARTGVRSRSPLWARRAPSR
jgi:DNA-binding CsgD family transcriptional regulator